MRPSRGRGSGGEDLDLQRAAAGDDLEQPVDVRVFAWKRQRIRIGKLL